MGLKVFLVLCIGVAMFFLYLFRRHLDKVRTIQAQKLAKDKKGVSAIEFAIVFPLFIVVILVTFNIFWYVICIMSTQNAMYSASRFVQNGSSPNKALSWACMTSGQRAGLATDLSGQPEPAIIARNIQGSAQVEAANGWGGVSDMGLSFLQFQYSGHSLLGLGKLFRLLGGGGSAPNFTPQVNQMYSFSFTRATNVPCNE